MNTLLYKDKNTVEGKITAIIPTYDMHIACLAWTVFSLLLRTRPDDILEHFIINITGPDPRCGDVTLQNNKENFLAELRSMKWDNFGNKKDMPITIIRTWSRVGHSQAVQSAIPWVHTEGFLLMHDDIVVEHGWADKVRTQFLEEKGVSAALCYPMFTDLMRADMVEAKKLLCLPSPNHTFALFRKDAYESVPTSWYNATTNAPFTLDEDDVNNYKRLGVDVIEPDSFDGVKAEPGAAKMFSLLRMWNVIQIENNLARHLSHLPHYIDDRQSYLCWKNSKFIHDLEDEIDAHPQYGPLYREYVPRTPRTTTLFHVVTDSETSKLESPPEPKNDCVVTVLTSTYNKAAYIGDAYQSMLKQTCPNWQWWVVLDNADAATREKVLSFKDPRIVVFDEPFPEETRHNEYRPSIIINKYYPQINTKYLAWLSDDDLLEPDFLEICINKIEQTNADIAYGGIETIVEVNNEWEIFSARDADRPLGKGSTTMPGGVIDGGCFVQTKASWDRLGGWGVPSTPEYGRIVDAVLMDRLAEFYQFHPVNKKVITHRCTKLSTHDRNR